MKKAICLCLFVACVLGAAGLTPQQYTDQHFGVMYSFGIAAFCCSSNEASGTIPAASVWNPTSIDIDQWLDAAVLGGARYVMLTTKYHMGFALWPTSFAVAGHSSYSIAQSSWYAANGNYDIVDNFCTKARARGLRIVFYFSIWDRQYEALSGTTAASNSAAYISMIETQLSELLTNYGDITAMWFDGWGWNSAVGNYTYIPYATIYNYVKSIQPDCLVIENSHAHPTSTSQVETYEVLAGDGIPSAGGGAAPSEADNSIQRTSGGSPDYGWVSGDPMFPAYRIAHEWSQSNANNASYLLNFGVNTDGKLPEDQLAVFQEAVIYRQGTQWVTSTGLGKSATASTTDTTDGLTTSALTDGVYESRNFSHVAPFPDLWGPTGYPAYAEIDLGSVLPITKVEAFNRLDCCMGGFRDLTLTIYDAGHSAVYTGSTYNASNTLGSGCSVGPAIFSTGLSIPVQGRYVRIGISSDGGCGFALAEISVRSVATTAVYSAMKSGVLRGAVVIR